MSQRRIVIAPDSFKATATAADVAVAIGEGWAHSAPDFLDLRPMADGGEGTLDAFEKAVPGSERVAVRVTGPTGFPVDATWLRLPGGTGVVELASTSGIELLGDDLRPRTASTLGFGQAIAAALDAGMERLILGIGSSSSTDGGTGLLTALGARFLGDFGASIAPGAEGLADLARADLSALRAMPSGGVRVLSDVSNPLTGSAGAAAVFGPQKGLAPDQVGAVDADLARLADVAGARELAKRPGAGAAGGAGFGLLVWGAELTPGAEEIADLTGLAQAIADADLVVTGEGRFDGQSAAGKVPSHVAALAQRTDTPVALVAGAIEGDTSSFEHAVSLTELSGSTEAAMADPLRWLREAGRRLGA